MTPFACHFEDLANRQHGAAAGWQLREAGLDPRRVKAALRGRRRVFRDVCALGDLDEKGWFMAAALAYGPSAAISHTSALMLLGLRPYEAHAIHVSFRGGGRRGHPTTIPHRRTRMQTGWFDGIPVTSPSQSLKDADLPPAEQYHALDTAESLGYSLDLPLNGISKLQRATEGRTKSVAEAAFVLLCAAHGFPLPRVNQRLNGFETDFHWPHERLVVEVDGWEFHKDRPQFEEDRRRTLVHAGAGWTVLRPSATHVAHRPDLVTTAIRGVSGW